MDYRSHIREVPDFPKPGISFKDMTPLLSNAPVFARALETMASWFSEKDVAYVVGIEARGFIIGSPLAHFLHAGFIPVRKQGKLPSASRSAVYELEYGSSAIEVHEDSIPRGARVIIVDDLLATGGTARATLELMEQLHAHIVGYAFLMELTWLEGRKQLAPHPIHSLISFSA
ncbi:MAG: adenine phosphoribosyltransferase [Candidatus Dormibacteria bacterium]